MYINVTTSEHFERSRTRFIVFGMSFLTLIVMCVMMSNIVGAVLLCLLMGGYMYYILRSDETIVIKIEDEGLYIAERLYHWGDLQGFVVEYHRDTQVLHNLVILYTDQSHHIYSFVDSHQQIVGFVQELALKIPFESSFEQSLVQQILRRIKM